MTETMRTVEIPWERVDRTRPVIVIVKDDRTATVEYLRATFNSTVDAGENVMDPVRTLIAEFAEKAARPALAVVIYDVREDPEHYLMVCTDEGDLVPDDYADDDYDATALAGFKKWLAANGVKTKRKRAGSTSATSVEHLMDDPDPEPEPEVSAESAPAPEPTVEPAPVTVERPTDHEVPEEPEDDALTAMAEAAFVKPERAQDTSVTGPTIHKHVASDSPFKSSGLMEEGKHSPRAKYGWQGAVNNLLNTNLAPGPAEAARRESVADIVAGWPGVKRVAVVNDKGGAGKTPVSILLAAAIARASTLPVAVFDNNESAGMAKDRVEVVGQHDATAKDLATQSAGQEKMSATEVMQYMHYHPEDRYHLLAAHHPRIVDNEVDPPLSRDEVGAVYRALAEPYRLVVTDSGNSWTRENWGAMVARADQLVVPMVTSKDRFRRAEDTLNNLYNLGGVFQDLTRNAVVVVSTWQPGDRAVAADFADRWEGRVREVVVIPYDEHVGSHNLRFDALKPATQDAFLRLGAAVVRGLRGE